MQTIACLMNGLTDAVYSNMVLKSNSTVMKANLLLCKLTDM